MFLHHTAQVGANNFVLGDATLVTSPFPVKYGTGSLQVFNNTYYTGQTGGGVNYTIPARSWADFTMEGYIYPQYITGVASKQIILKFGDFTIYATPGSTNWNIYFSAGSAAIQWSAYPVSNPALPYNTWTWFALVRESGYFRFYVNGANAYTLQLYPATPYDVSTQSTVTNITDGCLPNVTQGMNGYLDEIRVSTIPRYFGNNVTPPTGPFVKDNFTELLCHYDGSFNNEVTF